MNARGIAVWIGLVLLAGPGAFASVEERDASPHGNDLFVRLPTDPALTPVANVPHGVGKGLWVHDGYAYASGRFHLAIIDVHDPTAPFRVAKLPMSARDVDVLETATHTVVGVADGGPRIHFVDATNPLVAVHASTLPLTGTSHNLVALPGTSLFYNSRAYETGIDIIDVSDPYAPVVVKVWNDGYTCHDITAYPDVGRAYCAGVYASYILDITDPLEPVTLLVIDNPDIYIHHWAVPTPDHRILVLGDEKYGEPDGCMGAVTTPLGTFAERTGALWFYDISSVDEFGGAAQPVQIGWVSLPRQAQPGACTSHFGDMIGDTGVMAVGWYVGGVILIDYDGPGLPRIVDQYQVPDSNAWDARYVDGHLFVGDQFRGLDVLRVDRGELVTV